MAKWIECSAQYHDNVGSNLGLGQWIFFGLFSSSFFFFLLHHGTIKSAKCPVWSLKRGATLSWDHFPAMDYEKFYRGILVTAKGKSL